MVLKSSKNLFAVDCDLGRRIDADTDFIVLNSHDRDDDPVADMNPFSNLPGQNKHGCISCVPALQNRSRLLRRGSRKLLHAKSNCVYVTNEPPMRDKRRLQKATRTIVISAGSSCMKGKMMLTRAEKSNILL